MLSLSATSAFIIVPFVVLTTCVLSEWDVPWCTLLREVAGIRITVVVAKAHTAALFVLGCKTVAPKVALLTGRVPASPGIPTEAYIAVPFTSTAYFIAHWITSLWKASKGQRPEGVGVMLVQMPSSHIRQHVPQTHLSSAFAPLRKGRTGKSAGMSLRRSFMVFCISGARLPTSAHKHLPMGRVWKSVYPFA